MDALEMRAALDAAGFTFWDTGGGCTAFARFFGPCAVYVTGAAGEGLPAPDDWMIGIEDDEGVPVDDGPLNWDSATDPDFAAALAEAIDRAQTLEMEQAATRRGDL
jgi:hypothetical protein